MSPQSANRDRINFFNQIKAFYEIVWHGDFDFRATHISLYFFLLNQNNRSKWSMWFKLPRDTGMQGACIGSKKTYYKAIDDLIDQKLIKVEKGINEHKSPRISIRPLGRGKELPIPEGHNGDTNGDSNDPSRGTQSTLLGVREEDIETKDIKEYHFDEFISDMKSIKGRNK